jgi:hypothetical protein
MPEVKWTLEKIKEGVDRYLLENDRLPTAWDYDKCPYLPSARQVQRAFGGLEALRGKLGYKELNYTKGTLRKVISKEGSVRGLEAEDYLEPILIKHFGEPYVHTQKRYYKKLKNRYDFFVYHLDGRFGIDVFTTQRHEYIGPNIRHKLKKYKEVPNDIPLYFVVVSDALTVGQIEKGTATARELSLYDNIKVVHLTSFLEQLPTFKALDLPRGFKSAIEN